jgi:hypothetical protein
MPPTNASPSTYFYLKAFTRYLTLTQMAFVREQATIQPSARTKVLVLIVIVSA